MSRPRIRRVQLPPHVHCTRSKGREYYFFHAFRGAKRAGPRVRLPGYPNNEDGTPNAGWWTAYRAASGVNAIGAAAGLTLNALPPDWRATWNVHAGAAERRAPANTT